MLHVEALRHVPLFASLPEDDLQWLLEAGTDVSFEAGEIIAEQGNLSDGFYVILEGQTEWMQQVSEEYQAHAVTLKAGDIFAELLIILDEPYPVTGKAITAVQLYKLEPDTFWELLHRHQAIMREVVRVAGSRSQMHEAVDQQQAKLVSLGTMAAGLAHEMNNPAAAVQRSSQALSEVLEQFSQRTLKLNQWPLTLKQRLFLDEFVSAVTADSSRERAYTLNPLVQSDLEDKVSEWLETKDVEGGWELASSFVEAGLTTDQLAEVERNVPKEALNDTLHWLKLVISSQELLVQIQQSSTRLSEVVKSIKCYSYMDKAPLQEIDLHEDIKSTLIILNHKLKSERIDIHLNFDLSLPQICAYGAILNQVWTNLIDNAIDALKESSNPHPEILIRTRQGASWAVVEIVDNGPGISLEVQSRLFEPFFTTKGVGRGSGLGLAQCKRIVEGQHKGSIRFESEPGRTQFHVRIPYKPPCADNQL